MGRYILPLWVITVYCSTQLGCCCIPVFRVLERNVWGCVMHHCERTHLQSPPMSWIKLMSQNNSSDKLKLWCTLQLCRPPQRHTLDFWVNIVLSLQAYTLITLQTHGSGCQATYPEVVTKPGHKPELKPTSNACVVDNQWPSNCHESKHSSQADLHTRYLAWAIFFQVKVPHKPAPSPSKVSSLH
jgi:hypothetical protein